MVEWLTIEEVLALTDGTLVRVTWSGGNGPHVYEMGTDKWGYRLIGQEHAEHVFIGKQSYHTHVSIEKPI